MPWALLVLYALKHPLTPGFKRYLLCFALLFTPQSLLMYRLWWDGVAYYVSAGGAIKAGALLALFVTAVTKPLENDSPRWIFAKPPVIEEDAFVKNPIPSCYLERV